MACLTLHNGQVREMILFNSVSMEWLFSVVPVGDAGAGLKQSGCRRLLHEAEFRRFLGLRCPE